MPKRIFISYRRSDTEWAAGRLRDSLVPHFGESQIFRDHESLSLGAAWQAEIERTLSDSETIVLALIGPSFVTEHDDRGRLIDNVNNPHRRELELAIQHGRTILPILVGGATMPSVAELPDSLHPLAAINAFSLRDRDYPSDAPKVIAALERHGVEPARNDQPSPTDERAVAQHWTRRRTIWLAAAAVGAVTAVIIYTLAPKADAPVATKATGPAAPVTLNPTAPNFQIILDRSAAMNAPFGEANKLEGAKNAVSNALRLVAESDNVSYREFGGQCDDADDKNTQLVVPFAPGKAALQARVKALTTTTGEQPTIASAVVAATGNFDGPRFKESRLNKIILITGDFRGCPSDRALLTERLRIYPDVNVDLHLIGAGLAPAAESRLRAFAKSTGMSATVHNAHSPTELDATVQNVLLVEQRIGEVTQAVTILEEGNNHLVRLVQLLIDGKDYPAADQQLRLAAGALQRTVVPKPEAGQPEDVRQLLELADEARKDQQRMLDAARDLVALAKSSNTDGYAKARSTFNNASGSYRQRSIEIEEIMKQRSSRTR